MDTKSSLKLLSGATLALLLSSAAWAQQPPLVPEQETQQVEPQQPTEAQPPAEAEPLPEPDAPAQAEQLPEAEQELQAEQPPAEEPPAQAEQQPAEQQEPAQAEQQPAEQQEPAQAEQQQPEAGAEAQAEAEVQTEQEIQISSQQATEIRHAVFAHDIEPVDVDIAVSIGAPVPTVAALHVVPQDVVAIAPEFRGHLHFVLADERIVIVDPCSLQIVAILA